MMKDVRLYHPLYKKNIFGCVCIDMIDSLISLIQNFAFINQLQNVFKYCIIKKSSCVTNIFVESQGEVTKHRPR